MDKPKYDPAPEGLLPRRRNQPPPPPPARLPSPAGASGDADRLRDPESRNLLLSLLVVALFAVVFVAALLLAGPIAPIIAAGSSVVSILVLWFLWRMELHFQPNGFFLSIAIAAFVAMFVPLATGLIVFLNEQQVQRRLTAAEAPPAQPQPTAPAIPRLTDTIAIDKLDPAKDDFVRVIRESRVEIDGKPYMIEVGDEFPLYRVAGEEVIFKAKDYLISLPPDVLRVFQAPRSAATPEPAAADASPKGEAGEPGGGLSPMERVEITRKAQAEATKRYPALAVKDTKENAMFLETYKRMKDSGSDFLKDPEWPLQLAEALAEREGWRRDDIAPPPETTPRAIPVEPTVTAESPDDAPGFPPFEPTPPPLEQVGDDLPRP